MGKGKAKREKPPGEPDGKAELNAVQKLIRQQLEERLKQMEDQG